MYYVTTIAGSGESGYFNGNQRTSKFYHPRGICVDSKKNVYVADEGNHCVRKISSNGQTVTVAGIAGAVSIMNWI
jgi:hypothetical protein